MFDTNCTTFAVVNLGCKVNRVESDAIAAALGAQGARRVGEEDADLIVVNTCTVTGEADKKTRKAVRHACNANPDARVIVTGCAVAIDSDTYGQLGDNVEVVQRAALLEAIEEAGRHALRFGPEFRTRVNLKIQDGCDHACTYCIVHVARGIARSAPFAGVVDEARGYLARGAKELVLAGIDLGSYSDSGKGLAQLVTAILEEADKANAPESLPARVRASSIEPHTLSHDLLDLLAESDGRLCRHLHLPLQSGSTKVLREMARPYDAEWFVQLVGEIRSKVPSISLTTDIIVGFPGETEDDFEQTLEVAEKCGFSKIHVFPYSMRQGTPAAMRADQVDAQVKAQRASRLRELARELRSRDYEARRFTDELVLVEPELAITESYHEIAKPKGVQPGSLVEMTLP